MYKESLEPSNHSTTSTRDFTKSAKSSNHSESESIAPVASIDAFCSPQEHVRPVERSNRTRADQAVHHAQGQWGGWGIALRDGNGVRRTDPEDDVIAGARSVVHRFQGRPEPVRRLGEHVVSPLPIEVEGRRRQSIFEHFNPQSRTRPRRVGGRTTSVYAGTRSSHAGAPFGKMRLPPR